MSVHAKKNSFRHTLAAVILSLFGKSPAKPTDRDLLQSEFKSSTQRMGVRFTEKIRNAFRGRWIKKL